MGITHWDIPDKLLQYIAPMLFLYWNSDVSKYWCDIASFGFISLRFKNAIVTKFSNNIIYNTFYD